MPNPPVGLSKRILILMKLAELVESEGTALHLKCYVNQSSFFGGGAMAYRILICSAKRDMTAML